MTNETDNNDSRVSQAYRDLATERTTPGQDQEILAMAARNTRTRYGLARAWIRPVAWAATIGLSLAFVLEMSRYTNESEPAATVEDVAVSEDLEADNITLLQEAEELTRVRAGPARPAAAVANKAIADKKEQADICDADARSSAEAWYQCIVALREEGRAEAASLELEALLAEYPEFEEPGPDR